MKYEAPAAEVILFENEASFMAFSGGAAGRNAAVNLALNEAPVAAELHKGNRTHVENCQYVNGQWIVTVSTYNHGGHNTGTWTYTY